MRNADDSSGSATSHTDRLYGNDTLPYFRKGASPNASPGCLLIHGFSGTPQEMRFLADRLYTSGYTVDAVRLAGHGTTIEDFSRATRHDWYRSARAGVEELQHEAARVVVIGQSMGALLALQLAVEYPQVIAAVVLLSPALVLSNPWVHRIGPVLPLLLPFARRRSIRRGARDVADRQARTESPSYPELPLSALHQLLTLQKLVRRVLPQVRQPALIIHSRQDHTCPPRNAAILQRGLGGPVRAVLLEDSFHVISIDVDKERVAAEVAAFVESLATSETRATARFCD